MEFYPSTLGASESRAMVDQIEATFLRLCLTEIVSFTAAINHRSRRVMEKIGMTQDPREDFDHPAIPDGDALQRHVLYRLAASAARPW
jgi:RimJ/RimL family protein N-acetyltransferase